MKTRFTVTLLMAACMVIGFDSCSASNKEKETDSIPKTEQMSQNQKKLVVFFSHTGENYGVGYIKKGNTHIVADMIADASGADVFEIVPEKGYPKDSYDECVEIAKKELESKARPAVKGDVAVEDYDVVFIGYPQWWGEPPMCVYTFIEKHDWKGKKVIPFVTHEGSGMGSTDRKIAKACKGADVAIGKGLAIEGTVAQKQQDEARKRVDSWIAGFGLSK